MAYKKFPWPFRCGLCRVPTHLHTLEEQCHDVTSGYQLFHMATQALSQTTKEVQCNDHEVLVRGLVLFRVLCVHLDTKGVGEGDRLGPGQ